MSQTRLTEGGLPAEHSGIPRWLEVTAGAIALGLLSPLLLVVGCVVRVLSGAPVFFCQVRIGRDGARFTLFKFRSMRTSDQGPGVTASDDRRVTGVGQVLRRTKLDELPQLWNVIVGDMSLVGPRPELPEYVDMTDSRWQRVLAVRPGISDPTTVSLRREEELLASVRGDREAFYKDVLLPTKLAGYENYIRRRTMMSDLAILLRTVAAIIAPWTVRPPEMVGDGRCKGEDRGTP